MAYEKDQHPTAPLARRISYALMGVATAALLAMFGLAFDQLSESDLMAAFFLWMALMGLAAGALLLAHKGVGPALGIGLVIALAFLLAMYTFYKVIWPSL